MKLCKFSLLALCISGCVSVSVNKDKNETRTKLESEETFRYNLPTSNDEPLKPAFPQVSVDKLKNGLTIYVVKDQRLPIADVRLAIKVGSANDQPGKAGLIDLTALMLNEGTKKLTSLQLAEEFANLGTQISISTVRDSTNIAAGVLSNKVDKTLELMAQMVQNPSMSDEDFERIKLKRQSDITASQGMPQYLAQVNFMKRVYGDKHPYANPSMGTLASVSQIQIKDLIKAHKEYFSSNACALIVVGDVDLQQVKQSAEKYFDKWQPNKNLPNKIADPVLKKQMQTHLVPQAHTPQTYLLLGQAVAKQDDEDLAALEVLQQILAGMPTSRLDGNLREKRGWTYGVNSTVVPLRGKGPMMVSTSIQTPFGSDALQEILKEFENLKNTPVTPEELSSAKSGILHSFANRYNTLGQVSEQISQTFAFERPINFQELYYDKLARVSSDDITRISKKIFNKEQMVAVAVGELDAMQIPLAKMDMGKVTIESSEPHVNK